MNSIKEIEETFEENQDVSNIQTFESDQGFIGSFLIKQEILSKIKTTKLNLRKENIFNIPFLDRLKRKNSVYYFVGTKEMSVDIKDTTGAVYLPLITKEEINRNLQKINSKIRSTISMVHLGAIKILLKSEFQEGINSPIKMVLMDNRINDRKDCILGAARGNLAYQKFMFTVYPKFGFSLNTKNLDKTLSFVHQFERSDLMNTGDKVFSITYLVAYALTNSHHSIDYKKKEYIELEDVFNEVGTIEEKQFSEITPMDNSWAINIAKDKKIMGEKYQPRIKRNTLEIGEPSKYSFSNTEPSEQDILKSVSKRIDNLSHQLEQMG